MDDAIGIFIDDGDSEGAVFALAITDDIISGWVMTDTGELVMNA